MNEGIGAAVRRKEDARLLTGRGCYSDDVNLPGQAYVHVLRSPHAHARLNAVDTAEARTMPGVLSVLTGEDYAADGHVGIPHSAVPVDGIDPRKPAFVNLDGATPFDAPQMPIARERVRHVGEPVAIVVAETPDQARDAAEAVLVGYDSLDAVTGVLAAIDSDAPRLWEGAEHNLGLDAEHGDRAATEAAFARAAHVVSHDFVNNRIVNAQMEPRSAVAEFDSDTEVVTVHTGTQGVHRVRAGLAGALRLPPEQVRVVSRDVGGGFGPRNFLYPEFVLVAWAARRLGRPVKWRGDRSEAFLSDVQGRDLLTRAALALDAEGRFLAMRVELFGNVGGNTIAYVPLANGVRLVTSIYAMEAAYARVRGVLTNTLPTGPFRGAGRPEAMFAVERLIDMAATELGMDRVEIRRRNLIPPAALPYRSPMGCTYDSGEFERNMDMTLELADWPGFENRRREARERGRLRGIGIANYVEAPVGAPVEYARIVVRPEGRVDVLTGTQSQGQGHETSFAQVISDWLGVPFDDVALITGDTGLIPKGGGTHSDRSIRMAGRVMVDASEIIIAKGKQAAAQLLETAAADIEFAHGRFTVAGTDRAVGLFDVARAMAAGDLPASFGRDLDGEAEFFGRMPAYPNGCAVCEIEIDPETGIVEVVRYATTDDPGRVVNPMIVHGQTHGGIAMGVGQALMESCVYDAATGQLLTGSFMDYCVPRADNLPSYQVAFNEVPTAGNPLGVKGGGEGGTTPALAAVINAVVDALAHLGVRHIDMPATPERVWRAIRKAKGGIGDVGHDPV